jgi:cell cycle arrest protein BUB3
MTSSPEAVALPNPPNDGITSLQYIEENATSNNSGNNDNNQKSLLASTSWDGALRLHDTAAKSHVLTHAMECGPLLCMAGGGGGGKLYTGGSDGSIRQFDIVTSSTSLIGMHCCSNNNNDKKAACSTLSTINNSSSLIASAGWDAKFHLWDVRLSSDSNSKKPVVTLDLPGKAFSMDSSMDGTKVVVATSGRKNCFIDIRSPTVTTIATTDDTEAEAEAASSKENPPLAKSILTRDSSLKYQTRCIKFFQPYSYGVAIGSIEGRVAIEYLSDIGISPPPPSSTTPLNTKKYAFKCHRVNDIIYPVNDIVFHPIHGTFATGGADGTVVTWDGNNKKKIANIVKLQNSIACLAYNCNGSELAMASSYTFEEGERDHPREEIYVREVLESEVKPKVVVAK